MKLRLLFSADQGRHILVNDRGEIFGHCEPQFWPPEGKRDEYENAFMQVMQAIVEAYPQGFEISLLSDQKEIGMSEMNDKAVKVDELVHFGERLATHLRHILYRVVEVDISPYPPHNDFVHGKLDEEPKAFVVTVVFADDEGKPCTYMKTAELFKIGMPGFYETLIVDILSKHVAHVTKKVPANLKFSK